MSRKLVRSGVQHSVTFSAVTRNAVSPKYELNQKEPAAHEHTEIQGPITKTIIENVEFAEEKKHIKSNRQKIGVDVLLDDNIQYLGANKHYQDNFQKFDDSTPPLGAYHLNGSSEQIQNLPTNQKPRNAVTKVVRQVKADSLKTESSVTADNELQAKIRRMKKKLQNANQKLKNIQENH